MEILAERMLVTNKEKSSLLRLVLIGASVRYNRGGGGYGLDLGLRNYRRFERH